jgi:hypothetical protein
VVGEQAVAVATVAGDVRMEVVAEVAVEVVVAMDAAEAVAAITRTITTTALAIQTMTAMSMKQTPTTEPMVRAANLQKPLPQIQVQSLIVPWVSYQYSRWAEQDSFRK